uniref:Large ribosomal subunit protein bL9m n=1 Tax=Ailuropoda melanoleuca TaxID=9646 RepID=A0A7N5JUW7_AILME
GSESSIPLPSASSYHRTPELRERNQSPQFKDKAKPGGRRCLFQFTPRSVKNYGRPCPEKKQGAGSRKTLNHGSSPQLLRFPAAARRRTTVQRGPGLPLGFASQSGGGSGAPRAAAGAFPAPAPGFSSTLPRRWEHGGGRGESPAARNRAGAAAPPTRRGHPRPGARLQPLSLSGLGVRGDLVSVKKSLGRNQLLPQGLAVYASPQNKKLFEEEKLLRQEGKLEKIQTRAGEMTVKFLRSCHLEVGMKNNVKWELNPEIVARHFFRNLGVVVAPHALKLPEEPITRWGEYWCEVTVNGLDTVRVPMSVVNFERPKTKRYKYWLAQQAARGMAPPSSQRI